MIYTCRSAPGRFFKQLRGSTQHPHGYVWCLWRPVKRFMWIFWVRAGEDFWLDDFDFEEYQP